MLHRKQSISCLLVLLLLCSLCACEPPIYNPNKLHAPFFIKQGDIEAEVSYGLIQGVNAGAAYAITDHLAIKGEYGFPRGTDSLYQSTVEAGIGTYGKYEDGAPWEIFLTATKGVSNYSGTSNTLGGDSLDPIVARTKYWRLALEAGFLTKPQDFPNSFFGRDFQANWGFTGRLSFVNYYKYDFTQNKDGLIIVDNSLPRDLIAEIAFLTKFGAKPAFFEFQYGYAIPLFRSSTLKDYLNFTIFSIGFNLCLY
jgi:hypothetical protein